MKIAARLMRPFALLTSGSAEFLRPGPRARNVYAVCLSSLLLWLAYFPVGWGWLGWVALVPFLALVRARSSGRRVFLLGLLGGMLFFVPALQWIRVADPRMYATWMALALTCSMFVAVGIGLVRRLDKRTGLPLVLSLPLVWTFLEYIRAHFMSGFAWYFLGHTQHNFLAVIQVADLGGAYAVTFLVAAVNALIFDVLYRWATFRQLAGIPDPVQVAVSSCKRSLVFAASFVATLFAGVLAYGWCRLGQAAFEPGPQVALIQGNLDQRLRNAVHANYSDEEAGAIMMEHYQSLCDQAMQEQPRPDLIVWPETSYPNEWRAIAPDVPPERVSILSEIDWLREERESRAWIADPVAKTWPTQVLLGIGSRILEADGVHKYNSAVLVYPDGRPSLRYDKIHRVPFGEYVPLRESLPWMNRFAPYDDDYSIRVGKELTRFPLEQVSTGRTWHFGTIICYEDTDPFLARQYARADTGEPPLDALHRWVFNLGAHLVPTGSGQPAVNFLVNISNDGWFDGSSEHQEHLAICRFRAVECRRSVARAVNMGISAVIDGNGRVVALPGPSWEQSKKVTGVLATAVPIDSRSSLYARWGDWLPWLCGLLIGLVRVCSRRPPQRSGETNEKQP